VPLPALLPPTPLPPKAMTPPELVIAPVPDAVPPLATTMPPAPGVTVVPPVPGLTLPPDPNTLPPLPRAPDSADAPPLAVLPPDPKTLGLGLGSSPEHAAMLESPRTIAPKARFNSSLVVIAIEPCFW
jgi:hypothetical protein